MQGRQFNFNNYFTSPLNLPKHIKADNHVHNHTTHSSNILHPFMSHPSSLTEQSRAPSERRIMNSYGSGSSGFSPSPSHRHEYQQFFSGGAPTLALAVADHQESQCQILSQQHVTHLQNMQKQSAFHTRVRDIYFASWGQEQPQPESAWQGHKNPKVYEGDEVHCFNTFCMMRFRCNTDLVAHIMSRECGEITTREVACLVRDWKALQIELSRCGKLTSDEISCLERAWKFLQGEQQKSRMITRELIGFLVLTWEILSGNRSRYTLAPPTNSASSLVQDSSCSEGDQGWRARFRYSTGNGKR